MTVQQKQAEVNKYDRLDKLAEIIATQVLNTNKTALNDINKVLQTIYRQNYNYVADGLKMGVDDITKAESKEEIKDNPNPFNEIAIQNAKDKDQIQRKVKSALFTSIFQTASVGAAFVGLRHVFESNLASSITMATTQVTRIENLARYNAMVEAEENADKNDLILIKVWRTQEDNRVRDAHARADGQEAQIDRPFYVGGEELMYPGDINGSPDNIVNCRCYIEYKFVKK